MHKIVAGNLKEVEIANGSDNMLHQEQRSNLFLISGV